MKTIVTAGIVALGLTACSAQQQEYAAGCFNSLMATPVRNAADLIMAAQNNPICKALAIDTMQQIVADVMARRGIR